MLTFAEPTIPNHTADDLEVLGTLFIAACDFEDIDMLYPGWRGGPLTWLTELLQNIYTSVMYGLPLLNAEPMAVAM